MVQALVTLNDKANKALNIVKARYGLKDKGEAIELVVERYVELEGSQDFSQGISAMAEAKKIAPPEKPARKALSREQIIKIIVDRLKKEGVKKIALFGSFARHEEREDSDVDILVEFSRGVSLMDLAGMQIELSEAIGRKIDLVTEGSISPFIKDEVKKDIVVIYP